MYLDESIRRGEGFPPIAVYQVGSRYFVRDGNHRVSVYRALGLSTIEAQVRLVRTVVDPEPVRLSSDLPAGARRREFMQRIPLDAAAQRRLTLTDPDRYLDLADQIEAWSARLMFAERRFIDSPPSSTGCAAPAGFGAARRRPTPTCGWSPTARQAQRGVPSRTTLSKAGPAAAAAPTTAGPRQESR